MKGLRAFTMPKWGIEMTEGTIAEWMVAEGADFTKGDVITLIETDKITNEYEAEFNGRMARVIAPAGTARPVGALLAVFCDTGEAIDQQAIDSFIASFRPSGAAASDPAPVATPQAAVPVPADLAISPAARDRVSNLALDVTAINGSGRDGRITLQDVIVSERPMSRLSATPPVDIRPLVGEDAVFASPLARRIAHQNAVNLGSVSGTGKRGRIGKADVLNWLDRNAPAPAPAPTPAPQPVIEAAPHRPVASGATEIVAMSPMRKAIARQLSLSKSTIPHFYLRNTARIDTLIAMRTMAKKAAGEAPSVNDYLIKACALALRAFPDMNIQVHGDEIHKFASADIAVAVATDKGLITPIVKGAENKSVFAISAEMRDLAQRARTGRLAAQEFQGGSFSISNLGMFGIEQFDAIINPPQGAILAVGTARSETAAIDHALAFTTRIHLSVSCDHRAIDGALGARFLAELTRLLETPEELTA